MNTTVTPESKAAARRIPAPVRREVLASGPCAYCGDPNPNVVDHVFPVSRGGTADRENLAPACGPCNNNKLDYTPEEWKAWRLSEGMCWPPKSLFEQIKEIAATYGLVSSERPQLDDEDGQS